MDGYNPRKMNVRSTLRSLSHASIIPIIATCYHKIYSLCLFWLSPTLVEGMSYDLLGKSSSHEVVSNVD